MALQSSGQIKLSEIATEFGGSAPHALSEYHGSGNAPASGEIQLAADFYGTSSGISLSTTINCGNQTIKVGIQNSGFVSPQGRTVGTNNDNQNGTTTAIGSIANNNISGGGVVESVYETSGTTLNPLLKFEMSTASTGWTSITVNGTTFNRTSMSTSDNQLYTVATGGATSSIYTLIPASGTISFSINQ
jgi:hypothetical protein